MISEERESLKLLANVLKKCCEAHIFLDLVERVLAGKVNSHKLIGCFMNEKIVDHQSLPRRWWDKFLHLEQITWMNYTQVTRPYKIG